MTWYVPFNSYLLIHQHSIGEWFNGKTAAFKVADLIATLGTADIVLGSVDKMYIM